MLIFRSILHVVAQIWQAIASRKMPFSSSMLVLFHGVVLSAVVIGLVEPSAITTRFNAPPAESASVEEAIERFAPEVRFHTKERYFPSSVPWFLERAQMHLDDGRDFELAAAGGQVSASIIPSVSSGGHHSKGSTPSRYFLQIDADKREQARQGDLKSAKTYVHFRKPPGGAAGWDIQYWFFFPYSGPVMSGPVSGAHEGDWEHITVRVDESRRQIQKIFYAAHDSEGRWYKPSQVEFRRGTHPVVYTAKNGHASYPRAGVHSRGLLPADRTAKSGVRWKTWEALELVAVDNTPLPGNDWLRYSGRWGQVGTLFSGPRGPAFQAYWKRAR